MLASKIRDIWFNDMYSLYSLPGNIITSHIIIAETEDEVVELHKADILKYISYKKLNVDLNYLWFEITVEHINNNRIKWMMTHHRVIKLTDVIENTLPSVPINYYRN